MVYPESNYDGKNRAFKHVWNKLDSFDKDIISLHEIVISKENADWILFLPNGLIIIISIMDYEPGILQTVTNERMIQFKNRPPEYPGTDKALKVRSELIKKIRESDVNAELITIACCYPFIDEGFYTKTGLDRISPRELTVLKEDLSNESCFENWLKNVSDYVIGFIAAKTSVESQIPKYIEFIEKNIVLGFSDKWRNNINRQIEEHTVNLHANNLKELYYGICSFLMRKGIRSGYIYSKSKEILDGLSDYMSRVRIPWSYIKDEKKFGYVLVDGEAPIKGDKDREIIIDLNSESKIIVKQGRENRFNIEINNKDAIYAELNNAEEEIPIHLKNDQIRKMFLKAFVIAEEEIDIISPWMNFGVVNDKFVELLRSSLDRGVKIRIIYGLTPDSSEYNLSRSNRSDQVAKFLRNEFSRYGELLVIKRDNIHYKLVLCDEKYKLEGGYNYLSFVGDYTNQDTRKEGSPYGTQVDEIKYLRKEYFGDEFYR